jgi:hypothetical protein
MRACNKEVRLAAQVHEGDARAERRGRGARMDASGRASPPGCLTSFKLPSTSLSLNYGAPTFPCAFFMRVVGADKGGTCVC